MSFLKKITAEKELQVKYELEQEVLKQSILDINNLYIEHDGEFLTALCEFIKQYKTK